VKQRKEKKEKRPTPKPSTTHQKKLKPEPLIRVFLLLVQFRPLTLIFLTFNSSLSSSFILILFSISSFLFSPSYGAQPRRREGDEPSLSVRLSTSGTFVNKKGNGQQARDEERDDGVMQSVQD